ATSLLHLFASPPNHLNLHPFPTRRSSDLLSGVSGCRAQVTTQRSISVCLASSIACRRGVRDLSIRPRGIPLRGRKRRRRQCNDRSEEHTSELQSPCNLLCRLLLEKKNTNN